MIKKQDMMKDSYEKKYIDNAVDNSSLVAPQVSGSMVLDMLGMEKQGDIYPELLDKEIADV
jgi:hypothetical protein